MSNVLVIGGGLVGLSTAMLLAHDGHRVTVLERDPAPPHGDRDALWERWDRPGVAQFTLLHFLHPRWTATMRDELPEALAALEALGGTRLSTVHRFGTALTGGERPGDDRFETVTARRPVLEAAIAATAQRTDGVTVRRGVRVTGLVAGRPRGGWLDGGVPHVGGVMTDRGETLRADLVVDTSGRRSPVAAMLESLGARRPTSERDDAGFVYYGRHYRSADGEQPPARPLLEHLHGYSVLALPGDRGTWGVGLVTSSRDRSLRGLRDAARWVEATRAVPGLDAWTDAEPISGIQAMAGIEDRYRRYVVNGRPVCTGLVAVGDAWACTNPALGRGATLGLMHAVVLRDLLRALPPTTAGRPAGCEELVGAFDERTEAVMTPWFRATYAFDRHRLSEIDAEVDGRSYESGDPTWPVASALSRAALHDPDVLRVHASVAGLLASPAEVFAVPGIAERTMQVAASLPRYPDGTPSHADLAAIAAGTRVPASAVSRAAAVG